MRQKGANEPVVSNQGKDTNRATSKHSWDLDDPAFDMSTSLSSKRDIVKKGPPGHELMSIGRQSSYGKQKPIGSVLSKPMTLRERQQHEEASRLKRHSAPPMMTSVRSTPTQPIGKAKATTGPFGWQRPHSTTAMKLVQPKQKISEGRDWMEARNGPAQTIGMKRAREGSVLGGNHPAKRPFVPQVPKLSTSKATGSVHSLPALLVSSGAKLYRSWTKRRSSRPSLRRSSH